MFYYMDIFKMVKTIKEEKYLLLSNTKMSNSQQDEAVFPVIYIPKYRNNKNPI